MWMLSVGRDNDDELGIRLWKEVVVASFDVLS
jgi:hypothetical protein